MKILWFVNLPLPEYSLLADKNQLPYGGWLVNASKYIAQQNGAELSIAFPLIDAKCNEKLKGHRITYYPFKPVNLKDRQSIESNKAIEKLIEEIKPDIVHIHGTEMPHCLSIVNACKQKNIKTVISIQGLVSIIEKHMLANLPFNAVYGMSLRNLIKKDNVIGLKNNFIKRGKLEREALNKVGHVIGRTTWDRACVNQINPNIKYHFCNETLREAFYRHQWNINNCEKYSIFLSQGQYPIKGLHYVIDALSIVVKKFPNTKLYIAGEDITRNNTLKEKLLITHYGRYIKNKIKKMKLSNNIFFIGSLNEKEMCERYLQSNLFICPSSIENSPNSLGEAMILGLPCIASYVGGIPDMLEHNKEGFLYQSDATYMLAHYISEIFTNPDLSISFSNKAKIRAAQIHNKDINTKTLIEIYRDIM